MTESRLLNIKQEHGFITQISGNFTFINFKENIFYYLEGNKTEIAKTTYFASISKVSFNPIRKVVSKEQISENQWKIIEYIDTNVVKNIEKNLILYLIDFWNPQKDLFIVRKVAVTKNEEFQVYFWVFNEKKISLEYEITTNSIVYQKPIKRDLFKQKQSALITHKYNEEYPKRYEKSDLEKEILFIQLENDTEFRIDLKDSSSEINLKILKNKSKICFQIKEPSHGLLIFNFRILFQSYFPTKIADIGLVVQKEDWSSAFAALSFPFNERNLSLLQKYSYRNKITTPIISLIYKKNIGINNWFIPKNFQKIEEKPNLKLQKYTVYENPTKQCDFLFSLFDIFLEDDFKFNAIFLIEDIPEIAFFSANLVRYLRGYPILIGSDTEIKDINYSRIKFDVCYIIGNIRQDIVANFKTLGFLIINLGHSQEDIFENVRNEYCIMQFIDMLIYSIYINVYPIIEPNFGLNLKPKNPFQQHSLKLISNKKLEKELLQTLVKEKQGNLTFNDLNKLYCKFRGDQIKQIVPILVNDMNPFIRDNKYLASGIPINGSLCVLCEKDLPTSILTQAAYYARIYMAPMFFLPKVSLKFQDTQQNFLIELSKIEGTSNVNDMDIVKKFDFKNKIDSLIEKNNFGSKFFDLFEFLPPIQFVRQLYPQTKIKTIRDSYLNDSDFGSRLFGYRGFLTFFSTNYKTSYSHIFSLKYSNEFCIGNYIGKNSGRLNEQILRNFLGQHRKEPMPKILLINDVYDIYLTEEHMESIKKMLEDFPFTEVNLKNEIDKVEFDSLVGNTDILIMWVHGSSKSLTFSNFTIRYEDIITLLKPKAFVMINACSSGKKEKSKDIVDAFLDSKAVSIVAPSVPVRYKDALEMTLILLTEVTLNIPPSIAIRHVQKIKKPENWRIDYYCYYGDPIQPLWRLAEGKAKQIAKRMQTILKNDFNINL